MKTKIEKVKIVSIQRYREEYKIVFEHPNKIPIDIFGRIKYVNEIRVHLNSLN